MREINESNYYGIPPYILDKKNYGVKNLDRRIKMQVYISAGSTLPVFRVDDKIAEKMMKVYDKEQKFEPIRIDYRTVVNVRDISKSNLWPIGIDVAGFSLHFNLKESQRLREAILKAEQYVEERL